MRVNKSRNNTHSFGEYRHLDAVVGGLLPEGEHFLLSVVPQTHALPAHTAVVEVRDDAHLAPEILTTYINNSFRNTSTSYSPGSVKLYSKVPWENQNVITASAIVVLSCN